MTAPTTPGVWPNVPDYEYHSWGLESNSRLKSIASPSEVGKMVPALYKAARENPFTDTTETLLGTGCHIALPNKELDLDSALVEGKWKTACESFFVWRDETVAAAPGMTCVLAGQIATIEAMRDAFWGGPGLMNKWARTLVETTWDKELSITWFEGDTLCKARLDLVGEDWIGDIKTTRAGNGCTRWFERNAFERGYFRQAGFYGRAAKEIPDENERHLFYFIVQETAPPYLVNVVVIDQMSAQLGYGQNLQYLAKVNECVASEVWPGYEESSVPVISTPEWAREKIEAQVAKYLEAAT